MRRRRCRPPSKAQPARVANFRRRCAPPGCPTVAGSVWCSPAIAARSDDPATTYARRSHGSEQLGRPSSGSDTAGRCGTRTIPWGQTIRASVPADRRRAGLQPSAAAVPSAERPIRSREQSRRLKSLSMSLLAKSPERKEADHIGK